MREGVAQEQLDRGIVISGRDAGSQPRQGQVAFYVQAEERIIKRQARTPVWRWHCAVANSLNLLRAATPILATFQRMFREAICAIGLRKLFLPAAEPMATAPASKPVPYCAAGFAQWDHRAMEFFAGRLSPSVRLRLRVFSAGVYDNSTASLADLVQRQLLANPDKVAWFQRVRRVVRCRKRTEDRPSDRRQTCVPG